MNRMIAAALKFIYPSTAVCMGCGDASGLSREWLCADCGRFLARSRLGARMDGELDGMAVAYPYKGPAGGMVRNLKFRGVSQMSGWMADAMIEVYASIQPTGAEMVASVPMHPRRLKKRGFNHSEILARAVAERIGLPYENLLIRTRNTPQQARLDGEERRKNLENAFEAVRPLEGRRILLVDDVYTTGETARECARTLRRAGAANVYFLAFTMGGN